MTNILARARTVHFTFPLDDPFAFGSVGLSWIDSRTRHQDGDPVVVIETITGSRGPSRLGYLRSSRKQPRKGPWLPI